MSARRRVYAMDLTEEDWHILAPLLPPEKPGGRPRPYPIREGLHGIPSRRRAGCAWRRERTWLRIHDQLRDGSAHAWGSQGPPGLSQHPPGGSGIPTAGHPACTEPIFLPKTEGVRDRGVLACSPLPAGRIITIISRLNTSMEILFQ
jgi:hypothetical protein